jgi:hypothetical protein
MFISTQPTGVSTPVVYLFDGVKSRAKNSKDTTNLYWFRHPESKILRPVLNCIDVDDLRRLDLGFGLARLCWLTDRVGGPRVQVGYNRETNLKKVTT